MKRVSIVKCWVDGCVVMMDIVRITRQEVGWTAEGKPDHRRLNIRFVGESLCEGEEG